MLQLRGVGPDLRILRVGLEQDRDVECRQVVGPQGEGAAHQVVHVHQGALPAPGAGEGEQVGRDPPDAGGLVVDHLHHLAVLGLQLVEQQRLGEAGNDGRGVVDLVRDAADELPHGCELLRLLELRLGAFLVGHVPRQGEHARYPAAFTDGGVHHGAVALRAVAAEEGEVETLHLSLERGGELGTHDLGSVDVQGVERAPRLELVLPRHHRARGGVELGHPALAIQHRDGVRNGLHHEAQVALRGRGGGERVHQGACLVGHLLLQ